jgi:hypothetical protein
VMDGWMDGWMGGGREGRALHNVIDLPEFRSADNDVSSAKYRERFQ